MIERKHQYIPGDPWLICDECGLKYRRSEMLKRWDGFMVCKKDHEPRHPQEFVRGKADRISFENARPDWDSQIGSNLLGSPDTNTAGATENSDGSLSFDGSTTTGIVIWNAIASADNRYRLVAKIEDYETGRAVLGISTTDINTGFLSQNGIYVSEDDCGDVITGNVTLLVDSSFSGKITPLVYLVSGENTTTASSL